MATLSEIVARSMNPEPTTRARVDSFSSQVMPFGMEVGIFNYVLPACFVFIFVSVRWFMNRGPNLHSIPSVGSPSPALSYLTAIRYIWDSHNIIERGYRKHKGALFKIPMLDHWLVVATDTQAVEDIRQAPEDVLSFEHALFLFLQTDYTLGPQLRRDPYHTNLIRTALTRNLVALSTDIHDEVVSAFSDMIPFNDEWVKYPALNTFMRIVCRTSNRVFVGVPMCRNMDYENLNIQFTVAIVKAAVAIKAFPKPLKPFAALLFSNVRTCTRRCAKHIAPIIEERRVKQRELGKDWADKPNDMLMWCMETAQGEEQEIYNLALRILLINFGAIHTTSMSFTFALYNLAANPEFIKPLREEVEAVVAAEGWSKAALNKMRKVDSFMKESMRVDTPGIWAMQRYSLKPFTFSNGQVIPAGTMVSCPLVSMQHDNSYYSNADEFDPWRFFAMRQKEGEGHKNLFASTNPEFLAFGHGKKACPGRFFAANELKAMLAHVVLMYDIKFENGKTKPRNVYIGSACIPGKGEIMFRKRRS